MVCHAPSCCHKSADVPEAGTRSRVGGAIDPGFHRNTDIHLHVDEGPAEGASAGVTMAAAMVSALTGRVVRGDVAMTGALSGQVLPVGGIEEKLLAAHRCGLAGVILPRGNERDVDEDLGEEAAARGRGPLRDAGR